MLKFFVFRKRFEALQKKNFGSPLNVPTNFILSKVLDWRWGLKDKKSCWYLKVQIVRQEKIEDWSSIIKNINLLINKIQ